MNPGATEDDNPGRGRFWQLEGDRELVDVCSGEGHPRQRAQVATGAES